ncbi:hypothetical protein NL676_000615 [Syzygium grande]|nr:hypothetical protein NL676_000615 [Syzygium grande]
MDTFQDRANNSKDGITIFAPTDQAFSSLKQPSFSNLTQDQFKSLFLFHALSRYYSLADFKNLSQLSPVSTFAGGQYTLNFTYLSGDVHVNSGWTNTKISSSVLATDPVAVYQVDGVLLPEAIFGTDIPPMPAPAPSPVTEASPAADTPSGVNVNATSPSSSSEKTHGRLATHLCLTSRGFEAEEGIKWLVLLAFWYLIHGCRANSPKSSFEPLNPDIFQ